MYAIAIDGELLASGLKAEQVLENLKHREQDEKIEVASFREGEGWIPVCLDSLLTH